MATRTVIIRNENGIHCRPSAVIIKEVQAFAGHDIVLRRGEDVCNPNSILGLMSMGLAFGEEATIDVSGPDEEQVADQLVTLLARNFDFPPLPAGSSPSDALRSLD